jgi:hypothetical protein
VEATPGQMAAPSPGNPTISILYPRNPPFYPWQIY